MVVLVRRTIVSLAVVANTNMTTLYQCLVGTSTNTRYLSGTFVIPVDGWALICSSNCHVPV